MNVLKGIICGVLLLYDTNLEAQDETTQIY